MFKVLFLITLCVSLILSIPIGTLAPACTVPSSTSMWCVSTLVLNNVNTANTASPTPFLSATSAFCSSNDTYMANAISQYAQFSPVLAPSYVFSSYNKFVQICNITTNGNSYNATCRYGKTFYTTSDYSMPGFWAMTTNATYGNATQTSLQYGFTTMNDNRVFAAYCTLYNDTTTAISHFMPPSCVTIVNNVAAMNICQTSFMENMPSCDVTGSLTSSIPYKPSALNGKSACVVPATASAYTSFTTNPLSCSNAGVLSNDGSKYVEGCGTMSNGLFAVGSYATMTNIVISISPASMLESFLF